MASWTTPVIHATSDVLAVADWNGLANDATFLYQAPYALYFNSVATTIGNASNTQITLGGTTASGYGFSVSSNAAVVPLAGVYQVHFSATLSSAGVGTANDQFTAFVTQNGTTVLGGSSVPTAVTYSVSSGSGLVVCAASDSIALWGNQDSGGNMTTTTGAAQTYLHLAFIGST